MQETQGFSLAQEDPTCHGATKSSYHNYSDGALESGSHSYWTRVLPSPCSATREATLKRSSCTTTREELLPAATTEKPVQKQSPCTAKNKEIKVFKSK